MNDYREVGVLSDQAMAFLSEEGGPYLRHYQRSLGLLPILLPPRTWTTLAGYCP